MKGRYLVLVFDWVGLQSAKPAEPEWQILDWSGTHWIRGRYQWDTGGMENFEAVAWMSLPLVSWRTEP